MTDSEFEKLLEEKPETINEIIELLKNSTEPLVFADEDYKKLIGDFKP